MYTKTKRASTLLPLPRIKSSERMSQISNTPQGNTSPTKSTTSYSTVVKQQLKLGSNLAGGLAVVELFGQEFDPLQHGGLETQQTHTEDTQVEQ